MRLLFGRLPKENVMICVVYCIPCIPRIRCSTHIMYLLNNSQWLFFDVDNCARMSPTVYRFVALCMDGLDAYNVVVNIKFNGNDADAAILSIELCVYQVD